MKYPPVNWLHTESGHPYLWAAIFPLVCLFDRNVPDDHIAAWWRSAGAWRRQVGRKLFRPADLHDDQVDVVIGVADLYDITAEIPEFDRPTPGVTGPMTMMDRVMHSLPGGGARGLEVVEHSLSAVLDGCVLGSAVLLDSGVEYHTLRELTGHAQGHVLGLDHEEHLLARLMYPEIGSRLGPRKGEAEAVIDRYGFGGGR